MSSNIWFAHAALDTGAAAMSRDGAARWASSGRSRSSCPRCASQVNAGDGPMDGFTDRPELASAGFGQGKVLVTPLQMALVTAAIANGGEMVAPRLVDRLVSADGTVRELGSRGPGPRDVGGARRATVRDAMVRAVEGRFAESVAGGAKVPGITTAGKSGSAELDGAPPHSWFVGFAPAEDPRVVVVVVVENGGAGADRAVPMGGRLLEAWLQRFAPEADRRAAAATRARGDLFAAAGGTIRGMRPARSCRRAACRHATSKEHRVAVIAESGERVAANVERVIVGKHREVRLALVALLCGGHLLIEDVPGTGKTVLAKAIARSLGLQLPAHPVHAGPAAHGRHRPLDLQPEDPGVRVPARPDHVPDRARGRDQPGHAQDPVGAAREHGGAPGHGRRRHLPDAPPVPGHRDPEPHRVRGHVRAAGGAARPVHAAHPHGLPGAARGDAHPRRAEAQPPASTCWRWSTPVEELLRDAGRRSARSTWTRPSPTTSCAS